MAFFIPEYLDITNESEYLSIIQEVQFENQKIKQIEKLIGELRNKYIHETSVARINTDPIVRDLSTLFEEAFGFKSFQLTVDHSQFPNAYTAPISSKVDAWNYKKCVKKSNQGLQFTPAANVNTMAVITSSLLLDSNYTDREIVAIILHEIGHNFSDSINNTLGVFSNFKKILLIPFIFTNPTNTSNTIRGAVTKIVKDVRQNNSEMVNAFNALKLFLGYTNYVVISANRALSAIPQNAINNLINTFNSIITKATKNPIGFIMNTVLNFFGKEDEYTSDSFVAMYGYGPDLSSALLKLGRHNITPVDEVFKSSTFGALYFAFFVESVDFIGALVSDNHPATAKRLLNILDTLEKEYSKDYINPKLKKETKKEIDEIRKLIELEMENKSFNGNFWRVQYNRFILSRNKNKGPKDKMVEEMLDKIESFEEE